MLQSLKMDVASWLSIVSLLLAIYWQNSKQKQEIEKEYKQQIEEARKAEAQRTRIEQSIEFISQRLDRIDEWRSMITIRRINS